MGSKLHIHNVKEQVADRVGLSPIGVRTPSVAIIVPSLN